MFLLNYRRVSKVVLEESALLFYKNLFQHIRHHYHQTHFRSFFFRTTRNEMSWSLLTSAEQFVLWSVKRKSEVIFNSYLEVAHWGDQLEVRKIRLQLTGCDSWCPHGCMWAVVYWTTWGRQLKYRSGDNSRMRNWNQEKTRRVMFHHPMVAGTLMTGLQVQLAPWGDSEVQKARPARMRLNYFLWSQGYVH